jgi:hypothetical protein
VGSIGVFGRAYARARRGERTRFIRTGDHSDVQQKPCQFYWHGLLHITIEHPYTTFFTKLVRLAAKHVQKKGHRKILRPLSRLSIATTPCSARLYHASDAAVWYSVTLVSKKFFSLPRSIVSLIHGNGFFEPYWVFRPIRSKRRSAMYCT